MTTYSITEKQVFVIARHINSSVHEDAYFMNYSYATKDYFGKRNTFTINAHYSEDVHNFISTFVPRVLTEIILEYILQIDMHYFYNRIGKYNYDKMVEFVSEDGDKYTKPYSISLVHSYKNIITNNIDDLLCAIKY